MEWCLICNDRVSEGVLRVVFKDTGACASDPNGPVPTACERCGNLLDGQDMDREVEGRACLVRFDLFPEVIARRERKEQEKR